MPLPSERSIHAFVCRGTEDSLQIGVSMEVARTARGQEQGCRRGCFRNPVGAVQTNVFGQRKS